MGQALADTAAKVPAVTETSFKCIRDMKPVRGFYVDNLAGNLDGTLKVANASTGGVYPPGSVLQLVPGEVMVKRETGFNTATKDWEYSRRRPSGGSAASRDSQRVPDRWDQTIAG